MKNAYIGLKASEEGLNSALEDPASPMSMSYSEYKEPFVIYRLDDKCGWARVER